MILGLTTGAFTAGHVMISLLATFRADRGRGPGVRSSVAILDSRISGDDHRDQRHEFPFPVTGDWNTAHC